MHKIKENIYWTGHIDWDIRLFHGYSTPHGSTYNAYLIDDEMPTLIDTVKHYGFEEMLGHIKQIIDPSRIKYIISNHTEMDHSGTIEKLLEYCPDATIVCSPKGEEGLKRHFKKDWKFKVVNSGDTLKIGKRTLSFLLIPMVHWPDSMVTYSEFDKILFSNDAFGQHFASTNRFADQEGLSLIYTEAKKYYGNIVLPYGQQVLKALAAASTLNFDMIAPSHGLIWRTENEIKHIISLYDKWANHYTDKKVLIAYDSMWESTKKIAEKYYAILEANEIYCEFINLETSHISDVVTEIIDSRIVLFGTPILNNRMLPSMAALLMYLKGLKPKNRFAHTFGSYGWSTIGFKELEQSITDAGFELITEGKYIKFIPDEDELNSLNEIIPAIKEKLNTNNG